MSTNHLIRIQESILDQNTMVKGGTRFTAGGNQIVRSANSQESYTRRSNLFCDHCRIKGHTRDNCWKIHGYPADQKEKWKNRKVAAVAQGESSTQTHAQGVQAAPTITVEQYNQLMALLEQNKAAGTSTTAGINSDQENAAFLAGIFCLL